MGIDKGHLGNNGDRKGESFDEIEMGIREVLIPAATRAAEVSVRPFLADRVLKAVKTPNVVRSGADVWFDSLFAWFRPVALASLILIAVLVSYNVKSAAEYDLSVSLSESVLGLPPVTLETAYELTDE